MGAQVVPAGGRKLIAVADCAVTTASTAPAATPVTACSPLPVTVTGWPMATV